MQEDSLVSPEVDDLLGHNQEENFVVEQIGNSYTVTKVGELEREDQWEVMKNSNIKIENPTYGCYKEMNHDRS